MSTDVALPHVWPSLADDLKQLRTRRAAQVRTAAARLDERFIVPTVLDVRQDALLHHFTYAITAAVRARRLDDARELIQRWTTVCGASGTTILPEHEVCIVAASECERSDDDRYESPLFLHLDPARNAAPSAPWSQAGEAIRRAGMDSFVTAATGVVVTMEVRDQRDTTQSYALKALPGTIFIDVVQDPVRLGELILHESAHTLLNEVFTACGVELDPAARWYSPWKQAYRPAYGLLHAGFAFGVLQKYFEFHAAAGDRPSAYARIRAEVGAEQWDLARGSVRDALAEVRDERVASLLWNFLA
ncbi:HEXXH motif-containing putative peptide modification protein [Micromonospora sp. NPDC049060]|uniref:aKG-HExxH-type peptide beta-hydroxylase n=1 Tax=unclassified Micromonospora TaxID=2617518 RepID=UPI0033FBEBF5